MFHEVFSQAQAETLAAASTVSFGLAFIAGVLTILSPCVYPLIPAFAALSLKEKKNVFLATFSFFIGFALVFVSLGLTASFVGELLSLNKSILIAVSGFFLILFSIMVFFGKGFSGIKIRKGFDGSYVGNFLFGLAFALGWSACVGPILGYILILAANSTSANAVLLLLSFSLGIGSLLFLFAVLGEKVKKLGFERYGIKNRLVEFNFAGKHFLTSLSNIVSSLILFAFGLFFIFLNGTEFFNSFDLTGTKGLFYVVQRGMLASSGFFDLIGLILLFAAIVLIAFLLVRGFKYFRRG